MDLKRVFLCGRLTKDIEDRGSFGKGCIAVSGGKDKEGNRKEPMFIDFIVFEKTKDNLVKYTQKGSQILIDGDLNLERWENSEGEKRSKHSVIAYKVSFDFPKREDANSDKEDFNSESIPF